MTTANTAERIQGLLEEGLQALDAGNLPAALSAWNRVLEIDPQHERAARLVADLEALVGQQDRARTLTGEVLIVVDEGSEGATEPAQGAPGVVTRRGLSRLQGLVERQAAENRELNDAVTRRYTEVLELREQLTSAEKQIVSLRERLATFERTAAGLEAERADVRRFRALYEQQLTSLEVGLAEQKQLEGAVRQQLVDVQAELERARLALDAEVAEHAATRTLLEEAQTTVEQVQRRMDVAAGEIGDLRRTFERERGKAEKAQQRVRELEDQIKTARTDLEARNGQVEALNVALGEALELGEQHAIAAERLQLELNELRAQHEQGLAEAVAARAEAESRLTAAEARLAEMNANNEAQLAEMTQHMAASISELNERNANYEETIRSLTEAGMNEARATARLRTELAEAQRRVAELEAGAAEARALEEQNATLHAEIANLNDDVAGRDLAIEALRNELRQRDDRLTEITQNLSRSRHTGSHETGRTFGRIAELEAEVSTLRAQLEAANAAAASANAAPAVAEPAVAAYAGEQHETVRRFSGNFHAGELQDEATAEEDTGDMDAVESDLDVEEVDEGDLLDEGDIADFSDFVAEAVRRSGNFAAATHEIADAPDPYEAGDVVQDDAAHPTDATDEYRAALPSRGDERPTDAFDAVGAFGELKTNPGRGDFASPAWAVANSQNDVTLPPTDEAPAAEPLVFEVDPPGGEPVFEFADNFVDRVAERAAAAEAGGVDATRTMTGMAFVAAGDAPPPPPAPAEAPNRRGKKGGQLSMRSSATARLTDPNLSPAEQLSWLVDEIPRLTPAGANLIRSKQIGAKEAFVVDAIDGSVSFADIVDVVGLPSHETSAILVDLLRRGVISSPSVE